MGKLFRNAIGERVVIAIAVKEKSTMDILSKEEEKNNTGILYSIGNECSSILFDLQGKEVMFAENSGEKLGIKDGFEYLLLHKSAVLCY